MSGGQLDIREKVGTFRSLITKYESQIALALPKHITPERISRMAITAAQRQPKLLDCTQQSIILSLLCAAESGFEPGVRGECYLVPFWNGKTQQLECQFIAGYKGLLKAMRNTGQVGVVQVDVVREGDFFQFEKGTNYSLVHKRKPGNQGEVTHAYVCVKINGEWQFEVMERWELDEVEQSTKSKNKAGEVTGPWRDNKAEMQKKTVIRRGAKTMPMSSEVEKVLGYEEDDAPTDVRLREMLNMGEAEIIAPQSNSEAVASNLLETGNIQEAPDFSAQEQREPVPAQKQPSKKAVARQQATASAEIPEKNSGQFGLILGGWNDEKRKVYTTLYASQAAEGIDPAEAHETAYMAAVAIQ